MSWSGPMREESWHSQGGGIKASNLTLSPSPYPLFPRKQGRVSSIWSHPGLASWQRKKVGVVLMKSEIRNLSKPVHTLGQVSCSRFR